MSHGLDLEAQPVIRWKWRARQPPSPGERLTALGMIPLPVTWDTPSVPPRDREWEAFRSGFAQLSEATPDLRFYRLVQIFNTPLLSLSGKEAGKHRFGFWEEEGRGDRESGGWIHFWFFETWGKDETWALEFAEGRGLVLWARGGDPGIQRSRLDEIRSLVEKPRIPV